MPGLTFSNELISRDEGTHTVSASTTLALVHKTNGTFRTLLAS